jgi:hypothetical protein
LCAGKHYAAQEVKELPIDSSPLAVQGLLLEEGYKFLRDGTYIPVVEVSFTNTDHERIGFKNNVWYSKDSGDYKYIGTVPVFDNYCEFDVPGAGSYVIKIQTENPDGAKLLWADCPEAVIVVTADLVSPDFTEFFDELCSFERNIELAWRPVTNKDLGAYEIRTDLNWGSESGLIYRGLATSYIWANPWSGIFSYSFYIKTVNRNGDYCSDTADSIELTNNPPFLVPGSLVLVFDGSNLTGRWQPAVCRDLDYYQVNIYSDVLLTNLLRSVKTQECSLVYTRQMWIEDGSCEHVYWELEAHNVVGNHSAITSNDMEGDVVPPSTTAGFSVEPIMTGQLKFTWTPGTELDIEFYEIRLNDANWGTKDSNLITQSKTTEFLLDVFSVGQNTFYIKARDRGRNYSTSAASASIMITAPGTVSNVSVTVIDNNVLITWDPATGQFPIADYVVKKGATLGTATTVLNIKGTYAQIYEGASGTYTYWIAATDVAEHTGNYVSCQALVDEPADYTIRDRLVCDWSNGTLTGGFVIEDGRLVLGVDATQTFAEHFTDNSNVTLSDFISDGWNFFLEPAILSVEASYEETFSLGALFPTTRIRLNVEWSSLDTTVDRTDFVVSVGLSDGGVTYDWTEDPTDLIAEGFDYVKIRVEYTPVTATKLPLFLRISAILDIRMKYDGGSGDYSSTTNESTGVIDFDGGSSEIEPGDTITGATSGATAYVEDVLLTSGSWGSSNAAGTLVLSSISVTAFQNNETLNVGGSAHAVADNVETRGVVAYFGKSFIDVISLVVTGRASDGTTLSPVVDFRDLIYPEFFCLQLRNGSGTKTSGRYDWTVTGY